MLSWLFSTLRIPVWLAIASIVGLIVYVLASRRQLAAARHLAITDELTGIPNRRRIRRFLEAELNAPRRASLAVLVFDLDNFKSYNDQHGHPSGDVVLSTFANVLTANLPSGALAGRYGGEEFMVVVPGADEAAGVALAQRVRAALRNAPPANALTVCAGVASGGVGVARMNDLIVAADRALYRAKQSGRDCVCSASDGYAAAS